MPQESGTDVLLQAVSAVSDDVVWVSGHGGTYARTTDGGGSWAAAIVPGADTLQFRDVGAIDERTAYLLSAGSGELSRIYKTTDAGATWTLQWVNEEPEGFYDCLEFWDADRGLVYGDAVDGELRILATADGGRTWDRVPAADLPAPAGGEGGFAASGTCLTLRPGGLAWVGTGAGDRARGLWTADWGRAWTAVDLPIVGGSGAGAFSITFWNDEHGIVFGGDLNQPDAFTDNIALTDDGGSSWTLASRPPFAGAIYGGTGGGAGSVARGRPRRGGVLARCRSHLGTHRPVELLGSRSRFAARRLDRGSRGADHQGVVRSLRSIAGNPPRVVGLKQSFEVDRKRSPTTGLRTRCLPIEDLANQTNHSWRSTMVCRGGVSSGTAWARWQCRPCSRHATPSPVPRVVTLG
jgi:photosystem II stability/assembly factor-like uncharacterized protein